MDSSILTLILLAPLAGAVLVALLPDRGKLPAWLTLITTLITFGLTLHLPAHFDVHQSRFQFEMNRPWIENPADLLPRRRGWPEPVARRPRRPARPCWRSGKLEHDQSPAEGLLLPFPSPADGDVRRLHLA